VRTRLTASSLTTNLRSSLNDGFNFQTNGNGRGFAGSCSGDSGGPVFLGDADSDTIVAVASFALSAWCRGTDFSYRLDRPEVLAWIRGGYLSAEPEPAR
jgi:secreted trypsin-like serine protease